MIERDPPLRDQLLDVCRAANTTVNVVAQAAVDVLMIAIIASAANADAAQRDIDNICHTMQGRMREAYRGYHDMAEAQRSTRQ